jgi:hypothetical protein
MRHVMAGVAFCLAVLIAVTSPQAAWLAVIAAFFAGAAWEGEHCAGKLRELLDKYRNLEGSR